MPRQGSMLAYLTESLTISGAKPRRRRNRRLRRWRYPAGVESRYATALVAAVNAITGRAKAILGPNLERWVEESKLARGDSRRVDAWYDEADKAIEQLKIGMLANLPFDPERLSRNIANETDEYNRKQWRRISRAAVGIDLLGDERWITNAVEPFVRENVQLVTNLASEHINRIGDTVMRGVRAGARHEQIARELFSERIPGSAHRSAKNRAKLIARDQIGKLNGELTEQRQKGIGVEEYLWRTVGDSRVRAEHAARAGKRFKWSRPPPDGHPGTPIQCRCYAEPVFGDEFDSDEVRSAPEYAGETVSRG